MKPQILSMVNDGEIQILIGDAVYHYLIDSADFEHIRSLFDYTPFKGLNFCKDNCREWWKEVSNENFETANPKRITESDVEKEVKDIGPT